MKVCIFSLIIFFSIIAHVNAIELQKIPSDAFLRGKFVEDRLIPGFKSPLHSEGIFVVSEKGILWESKKPFDSMMVITPNGLTQEIDGTQTMNLPASRLPYFAHLRLIINGMIAGNWDALKDDFIIKSDGSAVRWQVVLIPKHIDNPAFPITEMKIKGGKFVDRVVITRKDDSLDTLLFSNQSISSQPVSVKEATSLQIVTP